MMNMSSLSNLRICSLFGAGLSGATVLAGWSHGDLPLYTMLAMATAVFSMAIFLFALKTRASIVVVSQALARLADGDFEARIADSDEGGELGDIVHRINLFADVADAFVRESEATAEAMTAGKFHRRFVERGLPGRFSLAARNLNAAAISLSNATEFRRNSMLQMAGAAESEAGGVADDVSYLTNEVSEAANNLHKMSLRTSESAASSSSASAQALASAETVAAATQQLRASISEISRQISQTRAVASHSVQSARQTEAVMTGLFDLTQDIGTVVELISSIARQTNLLALNATIEAARAGNAGKGFAVVANEVKTLANQTAKATGEITLKVTTIRDVASQVMSATSTMARTIGEVGSATASIAAAVEEQSAATNEIAQTVHETAVAANQVSSLMIEVAGQAEKSKEFSEDVMKDCTRVTETVSGMKRSLARVIRTSANEVCRRKNPRFGILTEAKVMTNEDFSVVTMTNISTGGVAATIADRSLGIGVGETVFLEHPDFGKRKGSVVACENMLLHMAFDDANHLPQEIVARISQSGALALLKKAESDHEAYVAGVMAVLEGSAKTKASDLANHHTCRLGKWYDTVSDDWVLKAGPFVSLIEPHKRVHEAGKETLSAFWRGDQVGARKGADALTQASSEVIALLEKLGAELSSKFRSVA